MMRRNPSRLRERVREDRQLNQVSGFNLSIQDIQRRRIDHVFGIVQNDHPRGPTASPFIVFQGTIKTIETVCLGRRAVGVVDHHSKSRIFAYHSYQSINCSRIVAVAADVNPQVLVGPDTQRMANGRTDNSGFLPRRDKHCRKTAERLVIISVKASGLASAGAPQPQPDQIHRKFVQRADYEQQAGKQQQFVLDEHEPLIRRESTR
jgi:hypothetical protein